MLCGRLIEMDTGEGKTVTAVITAAAHALAGRSVHVVTVNDYLAERDAEEMGPVYRGARPLGRLRQPGHGAGRARRGLWRLGRLVTPKQLMFDYLRDRIRLVPPPASPLSTDIAVLRGARPGPDGAGFYLRGLQVAILDEADSVLIDEAIVPLIISRQEHAPDQSRIAADAIRLAAQLARGHDFIKCEAGARLWLTERGRDRLEQMARLIEGVFSAKVWREQYCEQALVALHLFRRDAATTSSATALIEIVDINAGRTMPDRSWERGLHQMIQSKEGIETTVPNEVARPHQPSGLLPALSQPLRHVGTLREVAAGDPPRLRPPYHPHPAASAVTTPHGARRRRSSPTLAAKDRLRGGAGGGARERKSGRVALIGTEDG